MRLALATSFLALMTAPALADTYQAQAVVDHVTIHPGAATVERLITLDLPAGVHEIVVPGLPRQTAAETLRLASDAGRIGSMMLATDRLPVTDDAQRPEVQAAEDEVERLEEALRQSEAEVARIRLEVAAAEDRIALIRGLADSGLGDALGGNGPEDLVALLDVAGNAALAARQLAFERELAAAEADRALKEDRETLEEARQALAALQKPVDPGAVLTFTIGVEQAGPVTVTLESLDSGAWWEPAYDVRLTTGETPALEIARGVVISQSTGQDWTDVALTLSTAMPSGQTQPTELYPQLRRILTPEQIERESVQSALVLEDGMFRGGAIAEAMEARVVAVDAMSASVGTASVTYDYATRVTLRDGVENLRLGLDTLEAEAEVWLSAAPAMDPTAYLMAGIENPSDEILLPGSAMLFVDGEAVGFSYFPLLAGGQEADLGFGPIEGVRLDRQVPDKSEGDIGVFTSVNEQRELAILEVENLTGRDWPVRLFDAIPYSEQDDLEIAFEASLAPYEVDPDGRRGLLEWRFDLAAGETREIELTTTLEWPSGYELR